MIEFENTIQIDRPVTEVFAFLADLENLPTWNYYILEVRKISSGPVGVGTMYQQVRASDEQDLVIAELHPDQKLVVQTLYPPTLGLEMTITVQDANPATLVRDAWRLDTGLVAPLEQLGAGRIKSEAAENLARLKEVLEQSAVILLNRRLAQGRTSRSSSDTASLGDTESKEA